MTTPSAPISPRHGTQNGAHSNNSPAATGPSTPIVAARQLNRSSGVSSGSGSNILPPPLLAGPTFHAYMNRNAASIPSTAYSRSAPSNLRSEAEQLTSLKQYELIQRERAIEAAKEIPLAVKTRSTDLKVEPERNIAVFGAAPQMSTLNAAGQKEPSSLPQKAHDRWIQSHAGDVTLVPDEPNDDEPQSTKVPKRKLGLGIKTRDTSRPISSADTGTPASPTTTTDDANYPKLIYTHNPHAKLASQAQAEVDRMYATVVSPSVPSITPTPDPRRSTGYQYRRSSNRSSMKQSKRVSHVSGSIFHQPTGLSELVVELAKKEDILTPFTPGATRTPKELAAEREKEKETQRRQTLYQQRTSTTIVTPPHYRRRSMTELPALLFNSSASAANTTTVPVPPVASMPSTPPSPVPPPVEPFSESFSGMAAPVVGKLIRRPHRGEDGLEVRAVRETQAEYVLLAARSPRLNTFVPVSISSSTHSSRLHGLNQSNGDGLAGPNQFVVDDSSSIQQVANETAHWRRMNGASSSTMHESHVEEKSSDPFVQVNQVYRKSGDSNDGPDGGKTISHGFMNLKLGTNKRSSYRTEMYMKQVEPAPATGVAAPLSSQNMRPGSITPTFSLSNTRPSIPSLLLTEQHQLSYLMNEQHLYRSQLLHAKAHANRYGQGHSTHSNVLRFNENGETLEEHRDAYGLRTSKATEDAHAISLTFRITPASSSHSIPTQSLSSTCQLFIVVHECVDEATNRFQVLDQTELVPFPFQVGCRFSRAILVPADVNSCRLSILQLLESEADRPIEESVADLMMEMDETKPAQTLQFLFRLPNDENGSPQPPIVYDLTIESVVRNGTNASVSKSPTSSTTRSASSSTGLLSVPPLTSSHKPTRSISTVLESDEPNFIFNGTSRNERATAGPIMKPMASPQPVSSSASKSPAPITSGPLPATSQTLAILSSPYSSLAYSALLSKLPLSLQPPTLSLRPGADLPPSRFSSLPTSPIHIPTLPPTDMTETERIQRLAFFELQEEDQRAFD